MYYLICEMGLIYLCFTFFIVVSNYLNAWNKSKTSKSSYSFRLCQTASPLGYTVWQYILKKKKKKIEQDQSNLHSWLNEKQQNCRINDYQGVYVKCFLCVKTLKKNSGAKKVVPISWILLQAFSFQYTKDSVSYDSNWTQTIFSHFSPMFNFQMTKTSGKYKGQNW